MATCTECGNEYDDRRLKLGYRTCLDCGSPPAVRTLVPLHKSGYVVVTNKEDLKGLDPKRRNE